MRGVHDEGRDEHADNCYQQLLITIEEGGDVPDLEAEHQSYSYHVGHSHRKQPAL